MKKLNLKIKKVIKFIGGIVVVFGMVLGILYFLPNELTFKFYNTQAIAKNSSQEAKSLFDKATKSFSKWDLISKNNLLGKMYDEKKYKELENGVDEVVKDKCSVRQEKISEFCENIFYLDGLVQYRLGENLSGEEQKEYYQKAIDSFQKALTINNKNSWAKENIDFILKKFAKQQKQQSTSKDKKQNNSKDDKKQSKSQNKDTNKQSDKKQGNEQNQNSENQSDKKQEEKGSSQENKNSSQNDKENKKANAQNKEGKSRLPKDMQEALEQAQKQMEENQTQEGFNRSKSAAQKHKYDFADPFDQMVQDFFGDQMFNRPNFTNEIQNPNEKDW